jgi:glycosyltransferase involved in cell wall biosynthesis
MILILITSLLLLVYIALLLFYRNAWRHIPVFEKKITPSVFISVIIPARNEEKNIADCLRSIQLQSYPSHLFEVIVVNDFSEDDTAAVVKKFPLNNLRLLDMKDIIGDDRINSYKKKGIASAISMAKGKLIVTTDADCTHPVQWLETIAACYEQQGTKFIAAPVCFSNEKSFLDIFQSLDFMSLQGITGASVYKGFHSMCNGANLAYEKAAYLEVGGFKGIDDIASGDDMLLMHKIAKRFPSSVFYLQSENVIVQTAAAENWKAFFQQRIRWASKATYYKDKRITAVLLLILLLNLLLLLTAASGIFYHQLLVYWFILVAIKTIAELFFLYPVSSFFRKEKLLWWFPIAQLPHIVYTVIAAFFGQFGNYEWKGRMVK